MKLFRKIIREIFRSKITKRFINSSQYWEDRYYYGGNSGRGSYLEEANIKANFLNNTIQKFDLDYIVDIGCGDGNNLGLFKSPNYFGIDLSETIIKKNIRKFIRDKSKKFYLLKDNQIKIINEIKSIVNQNNTIILSFDVIFHLVEDTVYKEHLDFINSTNANYCLVVSTDKHVHYDYSKPHVRHRNYSKDLKLNGWKFLDSKKIIKCQDKREIKLFQRD